MKELSNYITEKLDINKVSLEEERFPIEEDINSILKFLKYHNFKEVKYSPELYYRVDQIDKMNYAKAKCFYYDKKDKELLIADTRQNKISNQNPMYVMGGLSNPDRDYWGYWKVNDDIASNWPYSAEEFLEKIEKFLY